METENGKENRTSARETIYTERSINVKGEMCRKLKRKYKSDKENITRMKKTVK